MSWNGSDKEKVGRSVPDRRNRNTAKKDADSGLRRPRNGTPYRGLVAGLIVVIGGGLAAYFFTRGEGGESGEKVEIKTSQIAEVKPQVVTNAVEEEQASIQEAPKTYRDEKGILRHPGGQRAYDPARPRRVVKMNSDENGNKLYRTSVFVDNPAEHELERFLRMKPGETMIGTRMYDSRFEEAYRRSCEVPIVVSQDDPPDVAEIKRAMIQVKLEINDRMRAGEKLSDIMNETRTEMDKMAAYKREMKNLVLMETSDTSLSEKDVQAYIDAANAMLEERGISALKGGAILRRNLSLRNKEKAK